MMKLYMEMSLLQMILTRKNKKMMMKTLFFDKNKLNEEFYDEKYLAIKCQLSNTNFARYIIF